MQQITAIDVYREAHAIINENPNGSHSLCRHFLDDGTPHCIVGHILFRLGYTEDQLFSPRVEATAHAAYELAYVPGLAVDGEALEYLYRLQVEADHVQEDGFRTPWKLAVEVADRVAEEEGWL